MQTRCVRRGENRAVSSSGDATSAMPGTAAICVTSDRIESSFEGEWRSESDLKTTMADSSPCVGKWALTRS